MSDVFQDETRTASHTLSYLRRMDRRQTEMMELILRQQEIISRLDRDIREGFSIVQRDVRELGSDLVLTENRILTRINAEYELSSRLSKLEEDLNELAGAARRRDEEDGPNP